MPLTERDVRSIPQRQVCQNGDTTFYTVPINRLGIIQGLHVDSAAQSGQTGVIRVRIQDTFTPLDGSEGTVVRFQTGVLAGDVGDIPLPGPISVFGDVEVNCNFSGPVVTLGTVFE